MRLKGAQPNGGGTLLENHSTLNLSDIAIITSCSAFSGWAISHDSSQDTLSCEDGTYIDDYIEEMDDNAVHDDNA
jgi:hypothetical protein